MRILAFTDIHGSMKYLAEVQKKVALDNPDLIVCLGDITIFGNNMHSILKKIDSFGKPVLLLHGNHEAHHDLEKECKNYRNIIFMHNKVKRIDKHLFIGWGGGGFSHVEPKFEQVVEKFRKERMKDDIVILLTHGPPYGTVLDILGEGYCGNKTYTEFIRRFNPKLSLSGHIHENHGKKQRFYNTLVVNPGPAGKILII